MINTKDTKGKAASGPRKWGPKPRKIASAAYVERAAFAYLQRFASSEKHLANILHRKIIRRDLPDGVSPEEAVKWVADVVAKCARLGLVDDALYARQRASRLQHLGRPKRYITMDLRRKGVADGLIASALASLEDAGAADLRAALRLIQRRRLGCFRTADKGNRDPKDLHQKDLAVMARAGFPYDLARRVLEASSETAEAFLRGEVDTLDDA